MPALTILHGCRTIQLTRGKNALIDENDFELVGHFKWHTHVSLLTSYARRTERVDVNKRRLVILHRFIVDAPKVMFVDHWNGDGLDNRRLNLRLCTHSQNHQNRRRPKGRSRFKGVHEHRSTHGSKFRAYFCVGDSKIKSLGTFATETEAARAYDRAAMEHYGEFAHTNADIHGDY